MNSWSGRLHTHYLVKSIDECGAFLAGYLVVSLKLMIYTYMCIRSVTS